MDDANFGVYQNRLEGWLADCWVPPRVIQEVMGEAWEFVCQARSRELLVLGHGPHLEDHWCQVCCGCPTQSLSLTEVPILPLL